METSEIEFVLEGDLAALTSVEAEDKIRARGGSVSSSVSSKTSYLVAGENAGAKLAEAEGMGVTVLNEEQFVALLGSDEVRKDKQTGQLGFSF